MKKILVVEDDPINATMVFDYLTSQGYDVALVMNGHDAVEKYTQLQPDLMLLDILLPQKNGFNVCMEIRRMNEKVCPIIMMSAVHNDEQTQAFVRNDLEVVAFISKPFKLKELLVLVEKALLSDAA